LARMQPRKALVQVSRFAAGTRASASYAAEPIDRRLISQPAGNQPGDIMKQSGFQTVFLPSVWKGSTHGHSASRAHAPRSTIGRLGPGHSSGLPRRGQATGRTLPASSRSADREASSRLLALSKNGWESFSDHYHYQKRNGFAAEDAMPAVSTPVFNRPTITRASARSRTRADRAVACRFPPGRA